jgi:outer membrane protein, heavy metal efflux system
MKRAFLAVALAGCVSSRAGYDDVADLVKRRTAVAIDPRDMDSAPSEEVRGLLAAPLTLDAVGKIALLNHPEVQQHLETVGMARAELVASVKLPNPTAHVRVLIEDPIEVDLDAGISVLSLLALPTRESAASSMLDAAVLESAGKILDVSWRAKEALIRAQCAQKIADAERQFVDSAFASSDAADRLREAGNITELEALERRALFEDAKLTMTSDEFALRQALEGLRRATAIDSDPKLGPLSPPAKPVIPDDFIEVVVNKNLDLRAIEARYASAAARLDLATLRGVLPNLEAGVGVEYRENTWGVGPSIGVGIPLFDQGQGQQDLASSEMRKLSAQHAAVQATVVSRAREVVTNVQLSRDRFLFYRDTLVPLRKRVLAESELQYNAMNLSVFQLVVAKQQLLKAERGQTEALEQAWRAVFDFDRMQSGIMPPSSGSAKAMSGAPSMTAETPH